ncbi:MAG: hypothetical protein MUC97_14025 [Bernardetiaceae bacterium]|nr:hypothetical protein [Bernardetiaceae bacterium]
MSASSPPTVQQLLGEFYARNQFDDDGGAEQRLAWIKFGFFSIPLPNLASRRQNVYLHDLSHLVTGYDTSWRGESAVSAWEIGAGGWRNLYFPWVLTLWAMGLGVILYPRSTWQAFAQGLQMDNALVCGRSRALAPLGLGLGCLLAVFSWVG